MTTLLERLQYGFDRDSRRTWRRRALTQGEDNAFGYDGLSQVIQSALGNLNQNASAIGAVPVEMEAWDYDPTGNWRGYQIEADGSITLDQQRVHDKGNRLMQIDTDPNPVLVDRAGRMTQVAPDASGNWANSLAVKWDAWGRITQIRNASDNTLVGSYAYDGLTRRTTRTVGETTSHCYYSNKWRPLEERNGAETGAAMQYYWGARHRDDLVRRDRTTTDSGSLNETRYVLMDYYSPAAITDQSGAVTERYAFSAFGIRRILTPDFTPRSDSECDFEFAFQGQFFDSESGFLNYGYRYYWPALGRWMSKDPIGVQGDSNLYSFIRNDPVGNIDRLGLTKGCNCEDVRWWFNPPHSQTNFEFAYFGASGRLGNNIRVTWTVSGCATDCKLEQNETGFLSFVVVIPYYPEEPPAGGIVSGVNNVVPESWKTYLGNTITYVDGLGLRNVSTPENDGVYNVIAKLSITVKCSDKNTGNGALSQTFQLNFVKNIELLEGVVTEVAL